MIKTIEYNYPLTEESLLKVREQLKTDSINYNPNHFEKSYPQLSTNWTIDIDDLNMHISITAPEEFLEFIKEKVDSML